MNDYQSPKSRRDVLDLPHSQKVLHDEFVYSFGGVGHIDFAFSITKIGLGREISEESVGILRLTCLFHDVCQAGCMVQMKAEER